MLVWAVHVYDSLEQGLLVEDRQGVDCTVLPETPDYSTTFSWFVQGIYQTLERLHDLPQCKLCAHSSCGACNMRWILTIRCGAHVPKAKKNLATSLLHYSVLHTCLLHGYKTQQR